MRYIDADKLLERMLDLFSPTEQTNVAMSIPDWLVREEVGDLIENTPTADVRENVKGEWLKMDKRGKNVKCSKCGNTLDLRGVNAGRGDANYCPNCGADMRGEK